MAPLIDGHSRDYPKRSTQQNHVNHFDLFNGEGIAGDTTLEPPLKRQRTTHSLKGRQRWVPGGRGGGGRRIDLSVGDAKVQTPVSQGGFPDLKRSRGHHDPVSDQPVRSSTRRTMPRPQPRYTTSTAAAAAADGYKPREERGWEEFHPDFDLESGLPVIPSEFVDGLLSPFSHSDGVVDMPSLENKVDEDIVDGYPATTTKRRAGRPARHTDSLLNGLHTPEKPRFVPPPGPNPRERLTLPRPSFKEHDPFLHYEQKDIAQVNFVDRSMAAVGYQESDIFVRPDQMLIRLIEGAADEDLDLAPSQRSGSENAAIGSTGVGRVEYDMDEQDAKWLDMLNKARRQEQVEAIKPAIFEITMTKIEKEWHALEKRIPRNDPKPPQTQRPRSSSAAAVNGEPGQGEEQDSKCAICDDGDCENANAIVFCDGCDLAVHQECYGVPYIPEGQWLCRKCQLLGRGTPACIFCPNTEGAFKQTNSAKWSHLLCASWIPEVNIGNMSLMEPVVDVEKVPYSRWRLTCFICSQKMGACIQCSHRNCYQAFHVTCARRAKMYLRMKCGQGVNSLMDKSQLKALCDKHVSAEWRLEHDTERAAEEAKKYYLQTMKNRKWADSQASALSLGPSHQELNDDPLSAQRLVLHHGGNRRNKTQKATWRLPSGAPVIPDVICKSIEASLQRFNVRKKKDFVAELCKYWTMKREARRGAPLLKRLQLQMDSFSSGDVTRRDYVGQGDTGRSRLERRIEFGERLLRDLNQIRHLTALIKEREALKLVDAMLLRDIVDTVYFPITPMLRPIIHKAHQLDSKHFFKDGLDTIRAGVKNRAYTSIAGFSADLANVLSSDLGVEAANTAELQEQVSGRAVDMNAEQRERRKLAKRIVKAIQPALEEALRNESELSGRPFERQIRELDKMLDNSILSRQESFSGLATKEEPETAGVAQTLHHERPMLPIETCRVEVDGHDGNAAANAAFSTGPKSELQDIAIVDAQTEPDEALDGSRTQLNGEISTESARILAANTPPPSTNGVKGDLPERPSTITGKSDQLMPEPPTTPLSLEGLQQCTLAAGGIPWYVEPFDVLGTTVHEERWTGPQVLREMSEELTDIGDEELQGLGVEDDEMTMQGKPAITSTKTTTTTTTTKTGSLSTPAANNRNVKKNGKPRRRWKGFR